MGAKDVSSGSQRMKDKRQWCCTHHQVGCDEQNTTTTYVFKGFGPAAEARKRCSAYNGVAMPKTLAQQRALRQAVINAVKGGKLAPQWPKNTICLGGHWVATPG